MAHDLNEPSPSVRRILSAARWLHCIAAIGAGVWSLDRESVPWAVVTLVLYATPLLAQWGPTGAVRVGGAWLAVFLIGQTMLSAALNRTDFITLPPNMRTELDVQGGLAGISGVQVVSTDERGFRVTPPIDYGHKRGLRIVAIGGSTTEQIYIDDRRTWTHLVQEGLASHRRAPVEVINTGVSGLRAVHQLATLRQVADAEPDLAVFLLGINDWNHHIVEELDRRGHRKTVLDPESQNRWRFFRNSLLGRAATFWRRPAVVAPPASRVERGEYYDPWRNSLAREPRLTFRPGAVDPAYAEALSDVAGECRRQGVKCMVITQPTAYHPTAPEDVRAAFWMTPPNQSYTLDFDSMVAIADLYNGHLKTAAAAEQLYVCDAASQIGPTFDNFYDDCHLNLGGSVRLAGIVQGCISSVIPAMTADAR